MLFSLKINSERLGAAKTRKRTSERNFMSAPVAQFPDAVRALLVEIVAMTVRSRLTASKSNTPPDDNRTRSLKNDSPNWFGIHSRRIQSSHSIWHVVSAIECQQKYRMMLRRRSPRGVSENGDSHPANGPDVKLRAAYARARRRGTAAAATNAQHEAIRSRRDAVPVTLREGLQPRARNPAARQLQRLVRPHSASTRCSPRRPAALQR